MLLIDVKDEQGTIVTDHLWLVAGKQLSALDLEPGDEIFFTARVTKYWKRNKEAAYDPDEPARVQDYRLSNPSCFRKLGAEVIAALPLFDHAPAVGSGEARTAAGAPLWEQLR